MISFLIGFAVGVALMLVGAFLLYLVFINSFRPW